MGSRRIEFGEWLPDLPAFNNPGSTVAKNVIPSGASYQSFATPVVYSNALSERCQGAMGTRDSDGNSVNFAGTASKIYRLADSTYSDVSKTGGYTTDAEESWFWARFNNRLIATNFNDPIQTFTVNTDTKFVDLSSDAPKARYITTIRDFVIVGNTFDSSDGNVPNRVRWPGIGDPTAWTVSATTQADYQDLDVSKGWVKQVVGGEYGVIFQESCISRMIYVGSPVIWQFDEVEASRGTLASGSVIKVGNLIFYLGLDGFYVFDGNQSIPIGANKVDKTFFADLDVNYFNRILAISDPTKQIIYWGYPGSGNTNGRINKILCYNFSPSATKRWTLIDGIDLEILFRSLAVGFTLDDLDTISSSIDALPFSLDSRVWTGNSILFSGFDPNHKQVNFTGSAMSATIETPEFQVFDGSRAEINLVRPLIDGLTSTTTVQVGTRNIMSESVTYGTSAALNSNGDCEVRSEARYHRVRVNIANDFDQAEGIEIVEAAQTGIR